jgi:amidophosphoribosyltransferase
VVAGRKVVLVDDSIIRGTTSRKIVRMVRDAGAVEVHMRIPSPPTRWPCYYGIDTPTREELIASNHDPEEIRRFIEADSLAYLSLEGMLRCLSGEPSTYCTACWSGEYPVSAQSTRELQAELFPIRMDSTE